MTLRIDMHSHFFPPITQQDAANLDAERAPWLKIDASGERGTIMLGERPFRPVQRSLWDPAVRIAEMDALGVDVQVMCATPVMFGYGCDAAAVHEWSMRMNDQALRSSSVRMPRNGCWHSRRCPCRTSSSRAGKRRARIARAIAACRSATTWVRAIWTTTIWSRFSHTARPTTSRCSCIVGYDDRRPHEEMDAAVAGGDAGGDAVEHGVVDSVGRLRAHSEIAAAVFRPRRRQLRLPARPRAERVGAARHRARGLPPPPGSYLDRFHVDSAVFDAGALKLLVDTMGEDRVLLGSDYPFPLGEQKIGDLVANHPQLSDSTKAKILGANPERFFASRFS